MSSSTSLSLAKDLQFLILENRDITEANRQLANPIVEALVESRLHRMALPEEAGGLETSPTDAFRVYESLAAAEASVAWIIWNNALPCLFARFLVPEIRQEIFGDPTLLYASSTRASGKAEKDEDNYVVNGRWSLVSGCMHAAWIPVMCLVTKGGEPHMLMPGVPNLRLFFVPKDRFERIDTWNVGGLRGTGSHDLVLNNETVPHNRSVSFMDKGQFDSALGRVPISVTMSAGCASICLGIARASLESFIELGKTKVSPDPGPDLRDRPANQSTIAKTTSTINALRKNLFSAYENLWKKIESKKKPDLEIIAAIWSASITTSQQCRSAVTDMYVAAGTSALYTDQVLERAHRDIHAVCQHIVLQPFWLEEAGRVQLGLKPTHPLFKI